MDKQAAQQGVPIARTGLRASLLGLNASLFFLALWVLAMVSLPILRWALGDGALRTGIMIGVVLQVLAVQSVLVPHWGWRRSLLTAAGAALLGWLAEYLGSTTGYPFGSYHYTAVLQPQIMGVPLLIPLAWLMMLPPAWAVAAAWVKRLGYTGAARRMAFIVFSALAFTAWDLFLDPQMVGWGFWVWAQPGGYFGIPWVNYLGWLLVSAAITAVLGREDVPSLPLLVIYAVTWLLQTIGQGVFWGQAGPALVGFAAMGLMLLPALPLAKQFFLPLAGRVRRG